MSYYIETGDTCTFLLKIDFLPFLKEVDACVLENENALQRYGSKLMEVTTHQLRADQTLEDKFKTLSEKLASSKENVTCFQVELTSVYIELTRKLCNTRIEEFLSSHHQIHAAKQGNATSGQNLRDCLLSHVNLKTQIN